MNTLIHSFLAFADAAANAAPGTTQNAPAGGGLSSLWIFLPIIGIMYFMMIRPQQKKQKQIQEMLSQLKVGDRVMTNSGALGTIVKVTEKTVRVAFNSSVEVDYVRAAIAEVIPEEKSEEQPSDAKK
ncbi:MAG: preprotein translocase subunit YajC [Victivallales bacterium]|nr:preprotein translocase subunit YajC [Victivallales bacterium]